MTNKLFPHITRILPLFSAETVSRLTPTYPELGPVLNWCITGWPVSDSGIHSAYFRQTDALSEVQGCLMWDERVIVPTSLREERHRKLHEPHLGIKRTEAHARLYVWFPGISTRIENVVDRCLICQERRNATPKIPVGSWDGNKNGAAYTDLAGPFMGRYLAVLMDATTGWLEAQWCAGPRVSPFNEDLCCFFARVALALTLALARPRRCAQYQLRAGFKIETQCCLLSNKLIS